ncbi:MAG TPA: hypothetical protein VG651_21495 [Stellaceae bacterium]|nr:hypothetical protein [Stellaceae bacterium]
MAASIHWSKPFVLAGLVAVAGCATPLQTAALPAGPIPPGQARIWFYRIYDPSLSRNLANIDLNGARVASVPPGAPVVVDVAPGPYHIAPESVGVDTNQTRDVTLAPGEEVFVKITDDPSWISGGDVTAFHRDTFYAWVVPPQTAKAEMRLPM